MSRHTTNGMTRVLALMPNGVMRAIRINERTGHANYVYNQSGKSVNMAGTYSCDRHGFEFHPYSEAHMDLLKKAQPVRRTLGWIKDEQHALARTAFHQRSA